MLGIEVLNHDEAETCIGGEMLKQLRERIEAPCGSTYANDGKG